MNKTILNKLTCPYCEEPYEGTAWIECNNIECVNCENKFWIDWIKIKPSTYFVVTYRQKDNELDRKAMNEIALVYEAARRLTGPYLGRTQGLIEHAVFCIISGNDKKKRERIQEAIDILSLLLKEEKEHEEEGRET